TALSATVNGLPFDGRTLYVRLWSLVAGKWLFNDYTYQAAQKALLITPTPGAAMAGPSATFTWSAGTGASQYWLGSGEGRVGRAVEGKSAGNNLSATVNGLPADGRTLYVRLWSLISGQWQFNDYTYTAAQKAILTTPAPGTVMLGPSATFTWSAGTGASQYWL